MGNQSDDDVDRVMEFARDGWVASQEWDDEPYVDIVRGAGEAGIRRIVEILRNRVDETDEIIACYGASLIIRSRLSGRVGAILEILRLPFRCRTVREEVLETVFDEIVDDPEFLGAPEFVSETRRIETRYIWVEEQIARFLENSEKMRG